MHSDYRYCFNPELVFSNNTVYTVELVSDSVLCIVTDNLPDRNRLEDEMEKNCLY